MNLPPNKLASAITGMFLAYGVLNLSEYVLGLSRDVGVVLGVAVFLVIYQHMSRYLDSA